MSWLFKKKGDFNKVCDYELELDDELNTFNLKTVLRVSSFPFSMGILKGLGKLKVKGKLGRKIVLNGKALNILPEKIKPTLDKIFFQEKILPKSIKAICGELNRKHDLYIAELVFEGEFVNA